MTPYNNSVLLAHFQKQNNPLVLARSGVLRWDDEEMHIAAYEQNPVLYALTALAPRVQPWQRARVLLQILRASQNGMGQHDRALLERVVATLFLGLAAHDTLTVLLALRRLRANHKHTTRAIVHFVLEHPQAEMLLKQRRPSMRDCFEHALGKSTARECARIVMEASKDRNAYLERMVFRFVRDPERSRQSIVDLYTKPAATIPKSILAPVLAMDDETERPKTVTATNRGDIAGTLVHLYRGGSTPVLAEALSRYVDSEVQRMPRFSGKVALVLDASTSTRSYGEREFACLAQSVALRFVLERCCAQLVVIPVGGSGPIPQPQGATDLARAVLNALEHKPDLVIVVSDGYENVYPGDLLRVSLTLPLIGIDTPILYCHSVFTNSDDLTWRQPAPNLPSYSFWHQSDFEPLLYALFSHAAPEHGEVSLRGGLLERLARLEKGMTTHAAA